MSERKSNNIKIYIKIDEFKSEIEELENVSLIFMPRQSQRPTVLSWEWSHLKSCEKRLALGLMSLSSAILDVFLSESAALKEATENIDDSEWRAAVKAEW